MQKLLKEKRKKLEFVFERMLSYQLHTKYEDRMRNSRYMDIVDEACTIAFSIQKIKQNLIKSNLHI